MEVSPFKVEARRSEKKELEGVPFGSLKNNPFLKKQEEGKKSPIERKFTPSPTKKPLPSFVTQKSTGPKPVTPKAAPPPVKVVEPPPKVVEPVTKEEEEGGFIDKEKLAQRQPRPSIINSTLGRTAINVAKLQAMFINDNLKKDD